ncbi:hypothetical protein [Cellulomonas alba]|uniref:Uncharacterized protein n=1 Tax=Cellulomonas alba TaxID=3053467 RepID=A0ABT7SIW2_9CELL|nr:hypothetical protein [Cellulomonas alba]MDM7855497.1 hypothetical protein [Cellulomonas alba]
MSLFRRRSAPAPAPSPTFLPGGPSGAAAAHANEEPSDEVKALAELALTHAVTSVVPEGGPLIPFAIVETVGGDRSLQRFVDELSAAQQRARDAIRSAPPQAARAAVAWDGYLTMDGQRQDAVFVEVSDRGLPSVVLAHRYHDAPGSAEPIGSAVLVERRGPLL